MARMEVVNDSGSQGLGYDRPVVDEDDGANGGEKLPVTEVGEQLLVPILAVVGEACQNG